MQSESSTIDIRSSVNDLIAHRLLLAPTNIRKAMGLPGSGRIPHELLLSEDYILLSLFRPDERQKISRRKRKYQHPYPNLITTTTENGPPALVKIVGKNTAVSKMSFESEFAFRLMPDASLVINDFGLRTVHHGRRLKYIVHLAFVVSYGNEIRETNIIDHLEDLVAYWIDQVRKQLNDQ